MQNHIYLVRILITPERFVLFAQSMEITGQKQAAYQCPEQSGEEGRIQADLHRGIIKQEQACYKVAQTAINVNHGMRITRTRQPCKV